VIRVVADKSDPVFILWGAKAQGKADLITRIAGFPGMIIKSSHPSPQSANRSCLGSPPFIGSEPFSKANGFLGEGGLDWNLDS
jgi:uracil DNA glycosylase